MPSSMERLPRCETSAGMAEALVPMTNCATYAVTESITEAVGEDFMLLQVQNGPRLIPYFPRRGHDLACLDRAHQRGVPSTLTPPASPMNNPIKAPLARRAT